MKKKYIIIAVCVILVILVILSLGPGTISGPHNENVVSFSAYSIASYQMNDTANFEAAMGATNCVSNYTSNYVAFTCDNDKYYWLSLIGYVEFDKCDTDINIDRVDIWEVDELDEMEQTYFTSDTGEKICVTRRT